MLILRGRKTGEYGEKPSNQWQYTHMSTTEEELNHNEIDYKTMLSVTVYEIQFFCTYIFC